MSEEKDKVDKLKGKQLSRREFLKDAGLVAGGAAVGSMAILSACGTETTITKTNTATTTLTSTATSSMTTTVTAPGSTITQPATTVTVEKVVEVVKLVSVPKSGYIEWNPDECASCSRCLMACAAYKQKAVAMQLSSIRWEDNDEFHGFRFRRPLFCQQCASPECYNACGPLKDIAFKIDEKTGARYIDQEKCIGCGLCVAACPFEVARINIDEENKKAVKCDLCKDRAGGPVCVEVCTRQALKYVTKEERV